MDLMNLAMWQFWAVVAVFCLIIELFTGGFFVICFAVGGIFSVFAVLLGWGFQLQLLIFALASLATIFLVRPFALKYIHRNKEEEHLSNADALIGRIGVVSQAIEANGFGRVALDGDDWKAQSQGGQAIAEGKRVKIVGRESIILIVDE